MKFSVIFHSRCRNVHIHATDRSIFMFDGINGFDRFQNVLDRIVNRILARFDGKTFVALILQCNDFCADLVLGEFLAGNVLVDGMIRTVHTSVHTIIGKIKRGKHYDTVAIKILFDLLCQCIDFLHLFFLLTGKKNRRLTVA